VNFYQTTWRLIPEHIAVLFTGILQLRIKYETRKDKQKEGRKRRGDGDVILKLSYVLWKLGSIQPLLQSVPPANSTNNGRTAANWLQICCSGMEAYEQVNRRHANRFQ
jgi:hypothetical protein